MKEHEKSDVPSLKEWRSLYKAATELHGLKPWTWMSDTEMFGVKNPDDGQMGYCCVLGELEEVFALVVYLGPEGLAAYLRLQSGEIDLHDPDVAHVQNCLMASFEDRKDLDQEDLRLIKKLGLKFRGRAAWPQFRSYRPGYVPWYLEGWEARFLRVALEQAAHVASRLKEKRDLLDSPVENSLLTRVQVAQNGNEIWEDRWMELPKVEEKERRGFPVNELRLAATAKPGKLKKETWEIDFFYFPAAVKEGERPYFPIAALIMDHDSGLALDTWVEAPWKFFALFSDRLLAFMDKCATLPGKILIARDDARELLQPITSRLGIKLSLTEMLANVEEFKAAMTAHL
jgi:hypothetical protein